VCGAHDRRLNALAKGGKAARCGQMALHEMDRVTENAACRSLFYYLLN
jgi:hypothetical protein